MIKQKLDELIAEDTKSGEKDETNVKKGKKLSLREYEGHWNRLRESKKEIS